MPDVETTFSLSIAEDHKVRELKRGIATSLVQKRDTFLAMTANRTEHETHHIMTDAPDLNPLSVRIIFPAAV